MRQHVAVSVLIATYRRAELLRSTLASIVRSDLERPFEIWVADNADDPATAEVCEEFEGRASVGRVVETSPGKNAALNSLLPVARGELFVFTDDDVEVSPSWLRCTWSGAARWPNHVMFGGRVLPAWPYPPPAHVVDTPYGGFLLSIKDPEWPEGPRSEFEPFGPNFAVRRTVFDEGFRFDPRIGPKAGTSYPMGSETQLIRGLKANGQTAVYLPESVVHHRIRPEQLRLRWLLGRAVRFGRSAEQLAAGSERKSASFPRWRLKTMLRRVVAGGAYALLGKRQESFDRLIDAAVQYGRLSQWRRLAGS